MFAEVCTGRQAGLQAGLCKPAGPSRLHLAAPTPKMAAYPGVGLLQG